MGVCGTGKSEIGRFLANTIGGEFFEGDDFHPPSNVEKMSLGKPLNDDDRKPWINLITTNVNVSRSHLCVIACSALTKDIRAQLRFGLERPVEFIYLDGSYEVLEQRLNDREDHFMKSDMLRSQLDTLERPVRAMPINVDVSLNEVRVKALEIAFSLASTSA